MSMWEQVSPNTWQFTATTNQRELDDESALELFNAQWPGAVSNPAVTVTDIDQYYTVQIDHDAYEVEAAVTFTRRYDHHDQLVEGLDT